MTRNAFVVAARLQSDKGLACKYVRHGNSNTQQIFSQGFLFVYGHEQQTRFEGPYLRFQQIRSSCITVVAEQNLALANP